MRTIFLWSGLPVRLYNISSTWMDDRAAFVQIMAEGSESADPRLGTGEDDKKLRCTAIWQKL